MQHAKSLGYTEPDPRDDLSGMDVARKLIILAREMGLRTEMAEVKVESLVPATLNDCGVDAFLERLSEFDQAMLERLHAARNDDSKSRRETAARAGDSALVGLHNHAT